MRIPENKLEEIRAAADIVDVVSGFVRLKKAGRFFVGLCPFHVEKTPSFHVNPERNIYKCFGCGKGGNAFTFLMEFERVSFVDAVLELAEKYHIPVVAEDSAPKPDAGQLDALYEANRVAARFFHETLIGPQGEKGSEYFRRRKWTANTIRRFGLGYAADAWDRLMLHARAAGLSDETLAQTGLIVVRDDGKVYDRFRGRVIFPIFSVTKKVIGFGARTLNADEQPKYLNSPETPIYVKSRALYGLSHAVQAIRAANSVVIVEGYADVISLNQAGIQHVVATSGTALTPDQVRILTRYTKNFYFLYDADSAGFAAMTRGIDLMLEQDCDPRIVSLPAGEDPDSFVLKSGGAAVTERMTSAVSFVDFITNRYQQQGKLATPEGQTEAVRHIVGMLAKMEDRIRRELYIRHLAEKYRIYESVLYQELETLLQKRRKARPAAATATPVVEAPTVSEETAHEELPKFERAFAEELLRAGPLAQREALQTVRIDVFKDERIRYLLHLLLEQEEHNGRINLDELDAHLGDDVAMHSLLADLLIPRAEVSDHWETKQTIRDPDWHQLLCDAYRKVLLQFVLRRIEELLRQQHSAPDNVGLGALIRDMTALRSAIEKAASISSLAAFDVTGTTDSLFL
jgi:DNA primase